MTRLSDVERLAALEAIRRLKAKRDRAADTKDWVLYESLHAPDHVSRNGDYPAWSSAAEMVANVSRIMADLTTAHHSHSAEIAFHADDRASGVWAMMGLSTWQQDEEAHWFRAFGYYYETYEKRADVWVFTSRELKYIHTTSSPGAIFPPRPEQERMQ
jgi:hypothetical protein